MPEFSQNRFAPLVDTRGFAKFEENKFKKRRNFFDDLKATQKYVVIKRLEENKSFIGVSPFFIEKGLSMITTQIKETQRTKNGDLLVLLDKEEAFAKMLAAKKLGDMPIQVVEHQFLNHTKGVVYCRDLLMINEEEIAKELKSQNIIKVERIKRKINNELKDTPLLILTFNMTELPLSIKAGFLKLDVRTYYPNPMRCHTCHRYGHTKTRCERVPICPKCAKIITNGHEETPCEPLSCANCKLEHTVFDQKCPTFQMEKAIIKIKTDERLTYFKAKEVFYRQNANTTGGSLKRLYSDVVQQESTNKDTTKPTNIKSNTVHDNENPAFKFLTNNNKYNNNSNSNKQQPNHEKIQQSKNNNNKNNSNNNNNNNNDNKNDNNKIIKNNNSNNNNNNHGNETTMKPVLNAVAAQDPGPSSSKIEIGASAEENIKALMYRRYTYLSPNEIGIIQDNDVGMNEDEY